MHEHVDVTQRDSNSHHLPHATRTHRNPDSLVGSDLKVIVGYAQVPPPCPRCASCHVVSSPAPVRVCVPPRAPAEQMVSLTTSPCIHLAHTLLCLLQSEAPLLLRIKIDSPMELGADISWLSMYPGECEALFPPLMFLKPMFKQSIRDAEGEVVTIKASFPS